MDVSEPWIVEDGPAGAPLAAAAALPQAGAHEGIHPGDRDLLR